MASWWVAKCDVDLVEVTAVLMAVWTVAKSVLLLVGWMALQSWRMVE
jgi:hypothetical protein